MKKAELIGLFEQMIEAEEWEIVNTLNYYRKPDGALKVEGKKIAAYRNHTIMKMVEMLEKAKRLTG